MLRNIRGEGDIVSLSTPPPFSLNAVRHVCDLEWGFRGLECHHVAHVKLLSFKQFRREKNKTNEYKE